MGAAIWSSTLADMRAFPLGFFLRFFANHGLLDVANRPQWYVIPGGSREYIGPLTAGWLPRIRLACPVQGIRRTAEGVLVQSGYGEEQFDEVILACHSDQALALLTDASEGEQAILGDMAYQANDVWLHTDVSCLPARQKAWASWNYQLGDDDEARPLVSYNMNILQGISSPQPFCVSLNPRAGWTRARCCAASSIIIRSSIRPPSPPSSGGPRSAAGSTPISAAPTGTTAFTKTGCAAPWTWPVASEPACEGRRRHHGHHQRHLAGLGAPPSLRAA